MQSLVLLLQVFFSLALPVSIRDTEEENVQLASRPVKEGAGKDSCDAPCRCNEMLARLVRTTTVYQIIALGGDATHMGELPVSVHISSDHQSESGLLVKISHTMHPEQVASFDAALSWLRIDYAGQMIYETGVNAGSASAHPQHFDPQLLRMLTDSCRAVSFSVFD